MTKIVTNGAFLRRLRQLGWLLALLGLCWLVHALSTQPDWLSRLGRLLGSPLLWGLLLLEWGLSVTAWRVASARLLDVPMSWREALLQHAYMALGKYVPGKVWGNVARLGYFLTQRSWQEVARFLVWDQLLILGAGALVAAMLVLALMLDVWQAVLLSLALCAAGAVLAKFGGRWLLPAASQVSWLAVLVPLGLRLMGWGAVAGAAATVAAPVGVAPAWGALAVLVAMLAGFVAVVLPAGAGVRELVVVALLASQAGSAVALSFAALHRLWSLAADLVQGAGLLLALRPLRRVSRSAPGSTES